MNKLIILATFLAVAVSMSCAMPNMQDEDDDIQALFQEIETSHINAEAQWFRKIVKKIKNVAKKVCSYVPIAKKVCGRAEIQSDKEIAEEQICKYITTAEKVCKFIGWTTAARTEG